MEISTRMRQTLHRFGVHSATIQPEFLDNDTAIEKYDTSHHHHPSSSSLSIASQETNIPSTDLIESQVEVRLNEHGGSELNADPCLCIQGVNADSRTCLLRCIENDSCFEQACCPPPYNNTPLADPSHKHDSPS